MAVVELIFDVKSPAWVTGNTNVPKNGEPIFLNNGSFAFGDGVTQVQALTFFSTGGGAWGSITGTLSSQTDLQTALNGKQNTITTGTTSQYFRGDLSLATFPTLVSAFTNDSGYITSSALSPYLLTSTAASTYQPLLGFTAEDVANKAVNFATLNNTLYPTTQAVSNYVTGLGYITSAALSPYLLASTAASTYQPIGSYLTANQTITLSGVVTGSGSTAITTSFASTTGSGAVVLETSPVIQTSLNINAGTATTAIREQVGTPTNAAIYFNQTTPSATNYAILGTANQTRINAVQDVLIRVADATKFNIDTLITSFVQGVASSGAVTTFQFTKPNNTGQTAGTNIPGYLITTGSRQWATGAIALQEEVRITAPTYSFVGPSTITDAATLSVNAPIAGTNATITNAWAIRSNGNINVLGQALVTAGTATTRIGAYGANQSAIWFNQTTPTTSNYALYGSATQTFFNATSLIGLAINDSSTITINSSAMNVIDGKNITFGTTTGSRLGTAANQRIGKWGATPIVQPTTAFTSATFVANSGTAINDASTFDGYTIRQVVAALRAAGNLA